MSTRHKSSLDMTEELSATDRPTVSEDITSVTDPETQEEYLVLDTNGFEVKLRNKSNPEIVEWVDVREFPGPYQI